MIDESLLGPDERAVLALRALYRRYGYLPFRVGRFEEYDFYARHKDFLTGEGVIAFNDTDGRLLALKPDVTLSILKSCADPDRPGLKRKFRYDESVFRISDRTHRYKEVKQTGIECVGDIDGYDVFEVVLLAVKSLCAISSDYVLQLSHLGLLSALLDSICPGKRFREAVAPCLAAKNAHGAAEVCAAFDVGAAGTEKLMRMIALTGPLGGALRELTILAGHSGAAHEAVEELEQIERLLRTHRSDAGRVHFDFSVVNDMNYYSGVVFRGFLAGVRAGGVLSGGRYDALLARMGRRCGGIGFAIDLDLLEELEPRRQEPPVDLWLEYKEGTAPAVVALSVEEQVRRGRCVSAQRTAPRETGECRSLLHVEEQND